MLTLIYVMNHVDRSVLQILLEDIKHDLKLSDTELGLIAGTLFALLYSLVGIPIARLADNWNRKAILTLSLVTWSGMTVLCGYATSFSHLALARMGIGLGEAGLGPTSHSMIADRFPPEERTLAFAILSSGVTIGVVIAFVGGGFLAQAFGWQKAFIICGVPGLILGAFVWFAMREPRQSKPFSFSLFLNPEGELTIWESFQLLWRTMTWRYLVFGAAVASVAMQGFGAFLPAYMIRTFEISAAQTGLIMGGLTGVVGTIGVIMTGWATNHLIKTRGIKWMAWSPAVLFAFLAIWTPLTLMAEDLTTLVIMLSPISFLMIAVSAILYSIAQTVVSSKMRAMSAALLLLVANVFGLGLGPFFVGGLSDIFAGAFGDQSLRYAMIAAMPLFFVSAYFFYLSGFTLPRDVVVDDNRDVHASSSTALQH